jgi:signal transduction histidine kinase
VVTSVVWHSQLLSDVDIAPILGAGFLPFDAGNGLFSTLTVGVAAVALTGCALSFLKLRRYGKELHGARQRTGELEFSLNEVESALFSESQILLVWRGLDEKPDRMAGSLHGSVIVPATLAELSDFASWLDPDSSADLKQRLASLRETGRAFNIGIKSLRGELLEADGRAAGAQTTLRLRPLAGERRDVTELSYDASKLSKQVQRLSAILDSAPFPIWIKDKDGQLAWANQPYITAVEAPDLQNLIKTNTTLYRDDALDKGRADKARGLLGRSRAIARGAVRAFNIYERGIDGGTSGFAIDVTPLEEAEKELERHIKAHASTLDKLDTAIAIFGPDQRLRFFNQAYVTLWALDEEWLKTQPLDGEVLDRLRAARALPEQANFREWKSKHLASYTTLETRESYWYLPDGRSLHVVCEQHPFGGVTYLYENLTKEYQLESKYNEQVDVQRETLDNLAESVALFGSDGRLKLYNPAFQKLWGLIEPKPGQTIHADQLAQDKKYSTEARAAWGDIRFALTGLDGSRKKLEGRFNHEGKVQRYRAVPLPDGNALLTFTDVSETERAEQALRERAEALEAADRLKSQFLANVSYQIRTPLTSISGFAETLDLGIVGELGAKQHSYIRDIRQSSDELASIIDAIIDLSAIDAGAMELRLDKVDVADLLERVGNRALPALERRNMSIDIEIAADVTSIVADNQRLEQIMGQLLSNAMGFSPAGATIRLGARHRGDQVQIWVADTGPGIEPDFQSKAFDRFQTKHTSGSHRGPGLGLSLVKSFTELHGGTVSLTSRPKQGTTVVCSFPRQGPMQKSSPQEASAQSAA